MASCVPPGNVKPQQNSKFKVMELQCIILLIINLFYIVYILVTLKIIRIWHQSQ